MGCIAVSKHREIPQTKRDIKDESDSAVKLNPILEKDETKTSNAGANLKQYPKFGPRRQVPGKGTGIHIPEVVNQSRPNLLGTARAARKPAKGKGVIVLRKKGRGTPDAHALKAELVGAWDQWEDKIEELSEEQQEQIKAKFNAFIDG